MTSTPGPDLPGGSAPVTIDLAVLRLLLAVAGLAAWATSGLLPVILAAPPPAAAGLAAWAVLASVVLVMTSHTWVPAAFLLAVLAVRLAVTGTPAAPGELLLALGFIAAVLACHSLAGLCAVTGGDGRVEIRALAPSARRFTAVTALAALALLAGAGVTLSAPLRTVLVVLAAAALVAVLAWIGGGVRR